MDGYNWLRLSSRSPTVLVTRVRAQPNNLPYPCIFCKKRCRLPTHLRRHMESHHKRPGGVRNGKQVPKDVPGRDGQVNGRKMCNVEVAMGPQVDQEKVTPPADNKVEEENLQNNGTTLSAIKKEKCEEGEEDCKPWFKIVSVKSCAAEASSNEKAVEVRVPDESLVDLTAYQEEEIASLDKVVGPPPLPEEPLEDGVYKCPMCDFRTEEKDFVEWHARATHITCYAYNCAKCYQGFTTWRMLQQHCFKEHFQILSFDQYKSS